MRNRIFIKYLIIVMISLNINATDYFLGKAKFPIMDKYRAEAFASKRIYTGVQGSEEYYTESKYLYLKEYIHDYSTGLNIGLYIIPRDISKGFSDLKYIIAFGGTLATDIKDNEIISYLDIAKDILQDLNLLNNRELSISQPKKALEITNEFIKKYDIDKNNITLTGHSLGGGLVQYVSHHTGIKGVTFNTAPYPIYGNIVWGDKSLINPKIDVVNIMSDKDQLTGTLLFVEDFEQKRCNPNTHGGELITVIPNQLPMMSDMLRELIKDYANIDIDFNDVKNREVSLKLLSEALEKFSQKTIEDNILNVSKKILNKILGFPVFNDFNYEYAKGNYYMALSYLIAKDYHNFLIQLKFAFNIDTELELTKLFLGERIVLKTNTGHGMFELIEKSYSNFYTTNLSRVNDIDKGYGEKEIREFISKDYIDPLSFGKFSPKNKVDPITFMKAIAKPIYGIDYNLDICNYAKSLKNKSIDINFIANADGSIPRINSLSYPCNKTEFILDVEFDDVKFDADGVPSPVYNTSIVGFKDVYISRLYTAKIVSNIIKRESSKEKQFENCNKAFSATIDECTLFLQEKCIIPNVSNYDFRPNDDITREELVVIAYKMRESLKNGGKTLCTHGKDLK